MNGLICPRCKKSLQKTPSTVGNIQLCMVCFGHAMTLNDFHTYGGKLGWEEALSRAQQRKYRYLPCPQCESSMLSIEYHLEGHRSFELDFCEGCQLIWCDLNEIEEFAQNPREKLQWESANADEEKKIHSLLAIAKLDAMQEDVSNQRWRWKWLNQLQWHVRYRIPGNSSASIRYKRRND